MTPSWATLSGPGGTGEFLVDRRRTRHVRHEHKYLTTRLPARHWFYFTSAGSGPAPAAGNLDEFVHHLHRAEPDVLDFHLARGDFSRWISGVLQDATLGDAVAQVSASSKPGMPLTWKTRAANSPPPSRAATARLPGRLLTGRRKDLPLRSARLLPRSLRSAGAWRPKRPQATPNRAMPNREGRPPKTGLSSLPIGRGHDL